MQAGPILATFVYRCMVNRPMRRYLPPFLAILLAAGLQAQDEGPNRSDLVDGARSSRPIPTEGGIRRLGASVEDTTDWRYGHSPTKATILSAVLPGAGQIYNHKYWKAPIAWAGLGVSYWFIQENSKEYRRYKDAYLAVVDGDPSTVDEFEGSLSSSQLLDATDTYRRWRDISYIAFGMVYILNVVDATVDAHFVRFDVGRDLSLNLGPSIEMAAQGHAGVGLALVIR